MKDVPPKHSLTKPRGWLEIFFDAGGWFVGIAAVICVVVTVFSAHGYYRAGVFEREGRVATAEIVDRRISRSSDDTDYYLTYQFEADDTTIRRERSVGQSRYNSAPTGTRKMIRYLPDAPRRFETYLGQSRDQAFALQIFAAFFGVAALATLWWFGSWTNHAVLARRFGYRSAATVTGFTEVTSKNGRPTGKGYMKWRTAEGIQGKSLKQDMTKLKAIGVGGHINVYVRKKRSFWEGDVGPAYIPDSAIPKVKR